MTLDTRRIRRALAAAVSPLLCLAACAGSPPAESQQALPEAPAGLRERLGASLEASRTFPQSPWRDTAPTNGDGTVNGYIEIPRGESTKWEFRIPLNRREIDRSIPPELGGYPVNYGFIPQTISYDGDPADVLVLGPPLPGGEMIKGRIVALMEMIDTGDLDSKVLLSPLDPHGRPAHALATSDRERMERFFDTYKNHQGKATKVTGWGDEKAAKTFLEKTSGFFRAHDLVR